MTVLSVVSPASIQLGSGSGSGQAGLQLSHRLSLSVVSPASIQLGSGSGQAGLQLSHRLSLSVVFPASIQLGSGSGQAGLQLSHKLSLLCAQPPYSWGQGRQGSSCLTGCLCLDLSVCFSCLFLSVIALLVKDRLSLSGFVCLF